MAKGIFITATGTDVGKTYISALLINSLRWQGLYCGYYKPVLSGSASPNDCEFVAEKTGLEQHLCNTYSFKTPVSPHLAAKLEGKTITAENIIADFERISSRFDFLIVEGAGGIITPFAENLMQTDIIKKLGLDIIIVADAGLGTINATVLTVEYAKSQGINIQGIILNKYDDSIMHRDNRVQIEKLTGAKIIGIVEKNGEEIKDFQWIM